jgi:hypothetical protein
MVKSFNGRKTRALKKEPLVGATSASKTKEINCLICQLMNMGISFTNAALQAAQR